MSAPTAAQLQKEFGGTPLEADAVAEGQAICQAFGLAAGELFIRWQTLLINRYGGAAGVQPTRERLLEVRGALQQESERRAAAQRHGSQASQATKLSRNRERTHYDKNSVEGLVRGMMAPGAAAKTPQSARRVGMLRGDAPASPSVFAEPSPSAARYLKRTNMGRTEDALHAELPPLVQPDDRPAPTIRDLGAGADDAGPLSSDESASEAEAEVQAQPGGGAQPAARGPSRRMRYMFEKIGARAETANRRIERMAVDVKAEYGIEALANPTYPHQDAVTAVGRIANISADEGLAAAAPISSDTLFLETSRRLGNGRRIALDVRTTPSFSLFPGQIVAIEGKNLKGTEFSAAQFRLLPRLRHPRIADRPGGIVPFGAAVAAGPYTLSDNLEYEPLRDLVDHIVAAKPDLVLLLGPFVSEAHPLIRDGQVDLLPEEIFAAKVSPQLARLRAGVPPTAAVLLVPSPDDLCHPYPSFPQPPLGRDLLSRLGVPDGVESLANPAQIAVNGVTIAVSNIDVLLHLVKEEVSRLPALSDRLPRLAWHLVEQRHFYPLATPPPGCAAILASHDAKLRMQAMPDVLVVPSQLRQFARIYDNVIILNPGHSSKGLSGGSFARLVFRAPSDVEAPDAMLADSSTTFPAEFASAEIVRV
ncbi:DNA-directed DNA polymerase alpha subunit pol12 [Coemansia javaensis]|uniref:DNA polymerase alpha subunit B n=1 Tax=Coemansia javaensis TaxID=2761396 RepID=A0A9W8H9N8_9FUNG|nr:DNA-directed DNA polymerase alpha subunit pol12 [Coemansia javaensis]